MKYALFLKNTILINLNSLEQVPEGLELYMYNATILTTVMPQTNPEWEDISLLMSQP